MTDKDLQVYNDFLLCMSKPKFFTSERIATGLLKYTSFVEVYLVICWCIISELKKTN